MHKQEAGEVVAQARVRAGLSWTQIAERLDKPEVWTTAALLGQHPMSSADVAAVIDLLGVDEEVADALRRQPYRGSSDLAVSDPTIYRFHEALDVYGPALKELIHEKFGDGIMSAINFRMTVEREADPEGDRVVVTLNGKFLDYRW